MTAQKNPPATRLNSSIDLIGNLSISTPANQHTITPSATGTYFTVIYAEKGIKMAVLAVVGINLAGEREVLGFTTGDRENQHAWAELLEQFKQRGLQTVSLWVTAPRGGTRIRRCSTFYADSAGPININLLTTHATAVADRKIQIALYYDHQSSETRKGIAVQPPYTIFYEGDAGWYYIRVLIDPCCLDSTKSYELSASFPQATPTPTEIPTGIDTPIPTMTPTPTPTFTPIALPSDTLTPTPTGTLESQPPSNPITGTIWTDSKYELTFVYVPAGEFLMGSTDEQVTAAYNDCLLFSSDCQLIFFEYAAWVGGFA